MKYILNESIKHILSERFILTEDLDYTALVSQCNKLLEYIKKLLKNASLDSDSDEETETKKLKMRKAADRVVSKTTELIRALEKVNDIDIARGRFDEYKKAVEEMIKIIDPNFGTDTSDIYKLFKDIDENLLVETADFSKTKKPLIKNLQSILPITTELSTRFSTVADSSSDEKFDSTKQTEILQSVYADIYRVSKIPNAKYDATIKGIFSPIIELLSTKMDEAEADTSKIANFLMVCEAAESDKGDSLKSAIELNKDLFKMVSADDINGSLADGTDWGKRYTAAPDKAVVWKEYLKAVWKDNADIIESFGEPFRQECEKLGFNGASNPFIAFLEEYLVKQHYPIDRAHYFAIHNAVAHGYLTKTDVVKPGDPLTEKNNIIFWEDFYLKGSPADYLEILGSLRSTSFNFENLKNTVTENVPEANKILFENISKWINNENKNKSDFIYVIMSATNSLNDLLTVDGYTIKDPAQRLRSVAEIDQLLNALDIEVTKKKAFSVTNIDTLITALEKPPYIDDIKTWAPKIIRRIADAAGSDTASIRAYESLVAKYPKVALDSSRYTWEEGQQILKLMSEIGGDIDWAMLEKIAKAFNEPPREWLK